MLDSIRRTAATAALVITAAAVTACTAAAPTSSPVPTRSASAPAATPSNAPTTPPATPAPTAPGTSAPASTPPAPSVPASTPPAASPTATPTVEPSATPSDPFVPGDAELTGTRWILVGYAGPDGKYVSPDADPGKTPTLRFALDDSASGSTGCRLIAAEYTTDERLMTITLADEPTCDDATITGQHDAVLEALGNVKAFGITMEPKANMAPGTTDDDFDARLLEHFADHTDVAHLILRDASGEAILVYGAGA